MYIQIETLCKQSRPIKSKGQNIKCRCYHVANFSTMASALYHENSACISSQEVKLQVKLPVEKETSSDCRQGSYPFLNKNFKDFSRTFKDTFRIFQGLHSVQKRDLSLCLF